MRASVYVCASVRERDLHCLITDACVNTYFFQCCDNNMLYVFGVCLALVAVLKY